MSDQSLHEQPFILATFVVVLAGTSMGMVAYSDVATPAMKVACAISFGLITLIAFIAATWAWYKGKMRKLPPFYDASDDNGDDEYINPYDAPSEISLDKTIRQDEISG